MTVGIMFVIGVTGQCCGRRSDQKLLPAGGAEVKELSFWQQWLPWSPSSSATSSGASTPRDEGSVISEGEEDVSLESELTKQLGIVAERLSALEVKTSAAASPSPPPPPPTVTSAPTAPPATSTAMSPGANYDQMMFQLLERLERHKEIVQTDSQAATAGAPTRVQEVSSTNSEVEALVRGLDDSFKDMRVMAKEKLEAFNPTVSWSIPGGIKTRVAPSIVARLYRNGSTAVATIRELIRLKQLEGNHMGEEMLLIAMMIDRSMIEAPPEFINYKTTELAMRRLHGIERAFENVKQRSDWKPPNGAKQGWKSRINYHVLEELDASKSDQEGVLIDGVEKELRERLAHRALLAKSLDKLNDHKNSAPKKDD